MSRFNTNTVVANKTTNRAGGEAYSIDDKTSLILLSLCSHLKDDYYRTASETLKEIEQLANRIDKKFVAKLALYTRLEIGNRTTSHILAGIIAKTVKGEQWTKDFFKKIVRRPDDMTEIVSYIGGTKALPNSVKKGFAKKFEELTEYQISKYSGRGKSTNLFDLVNTCHPKSTEVIRRFVNGEIKSPKTWEVELSAAGSDVNSKIAAWNKLLDDGRVGCLAAIRNIRNVVSLNDKELTAKLLNRVASIDKDVLPNQFITAFDNLDKPISQEIIRAIDIACERSLDNISALDGMTLIAVDDSGSMEGKPLETAISMAIPLFKKGNSDMLFFGSDAKYMSFNSLDSTLSLMNQLRSACRSGGTNFRCIFEEIEKRGKVYDNIIILSDMQGWMGDYNNNGAKTPFNNYVKNISPECKLYTFDTTGYGTMQFPQGNVFALGGVSPRVFDSLNYMSKGNGLIKLVDEYNL